jgi:pimeloyl-ACP methyl ester carboxylesterase
VGLVVTICLGASDAFAQDAPKPLGVLVSAAGHRIHVYCIGTGSPAVVLLPGMGSFSFEWALTQPLLASHTTVCSYDRSGAAWSEPGPRPRTLRQEVYTLTEALRAAGVAPPFVLVGQSIGGMIARLFQREHPDLVAGIVFVDSTSENSQLVKQGKRVLMRAEATGRPIPPPRDGNPPQDRLSTGQRKEAEDYIAKFVRPRIEAPFDKLPRWAQEARIWALSQPESLGGPGDMMADEFAELHAYIQAHPAFLGTIPLAVLVAGPTVADDDRELAALSRNSVLLSAPSSGHHIQIDDPEVVTCAVVGVLKAVRSSSSVGTADCQPR